MKQAIFNGFTAGFVPDLPDLQLPDGAWSDSRNVRYRDGAAEKCIGYATTFGELSTTAIWAAAIADAATAYWVYGNGNAMYATDGSTHADITGTLSLSATGDLGYTGGAFHGFMVVTDGVQIPQSWAPSLSNNLISLTAWPAITCEVIRPWRDFLIALRISEIGTLNPRLMRWSDAAPSGALPASWDYADPTNQAGIKEFGESNDTLIDCAGMRDSLIVYKQNATWIADYVGGVDVLSFRQLFSQSGALSQDCIGVTGTSHVVLTGEDVIVHDGNAATSLLDRRTRRWFANRIDPTNYRRSFVAMDHQNREAYIAFPEAGQTKATLALVWNWAENTIHPMELPPGMAFGAAGPVTTTGGTFDSDTAIFDSGADPFDTELGSLYRQALVWWSGTKAYQHGSSESVAGTAMTAWLERTGTPLTADMGSIKRIWRIWPWVISSAGEVIRFYVGTRETLNSVISYSGPYPFTVGTDTWIDLRLDGRVIDLRVEYVGTKTFRLHGFSVDYEDSGAR